MPFPNISEIIKEGDIVDDDSLYGGSNFGDNAKYSTQSLLMLAMSRTIISGTKEMRSGYWNSKFDKFGNETTVYIEDTRKAFIECVKNVIMIISSEFDEEMNNKLIKFKIDIKDKLNHFITLEELDWKNSSMIVKADRNKRGIIFRKGYLSTDLPFYNEYLNECVDVYREIFEEIQKSLRRTYYGEEIGISN